ncbi:MAG: hypothetical protein FWF09_08515, partial [Bacteroidales bacterium]|nr:hypothetical protein [Bacteroidales bacterium]
MKRLELVNIISSTISVLRKFTLKTANCLVIMLLAVCIVGCKKDPKNPERSELNGKIGLKFVTPSTQKMVLKSVTNQNEEIKGMFFSV